MSDYEAFVSIAAPPRRVWSVLTDLDRMHEWAPGEVKLEGRMLEGEPLFLYGFTAGEKPLALKVATLDAPNLLRLELRWPLWLLRAHREVALEADGQGTQVRLSDGLGGLLGWLARGKLPDLSDQLSAFGEALRRRVEQPEG